MTKPSAPPVIKSLTVIGLQYKAPPPRIYGNSKTMGTFPTRALVIQVETDDGVIGIGDAGGSPATIREHLDALRPLFLGRSVYDFEVIQSGIRNRGYHAGVQNDITGVLAGIDCALLDAIGKMHGARVCDLLGGCATPRVPVYASTGYFSADPAITYENMLEKVRDTGFLAAKIKIGRGVKSDVERVQTARDILGDDILLIADMNAAYTPDVALESMRALTPFNLHWVEEPIPPWDFAGYAELRQRSPFPLSAGEALYTAREFNLLIAGRCVDIVQPSIAMTGGLREAKRIAFLAQLNNLRLAPHVWGSGLALAVGTQFAASLPNAPNPDYPAYPTFIEFDIGTENPLRDSMLKTPIALEDSHVVLPDGPGLGIEIDWDAMEQYRIF